MLDHWRSSMAGLIQDKLTFAAARVVDYPGGPIRANGYVHGALPHRVLPDRFSLPRFSAGSAPHRTFRGLLKLHTRYGLPGCSPTFPWTLSRGFGPAGFPTVPLASYRI
jgi:hypothetical protein